MSIREIYNNFIKESSLFSLNAGVVNWEYITFGAGSKTLLILNGGLRIAESGFLYASILKEDFKVVIPTYPPLKNIDDMVQGLWDIIKKEKSGDLFLFAQSYGGMIAEIMMKQDPDIFEKAVLSGTKMVKANFIEILKLNFKLQLISLLPEKLVTKIYKRNLLSVINYPESEKEFWQDYLNDLFDNNLGKADVLSHFSTSIDVLKRYSQKSLESHMHDKILLLRGEDDALITEANLFELSIHYGNAVYKNIKGGRHTSGIDQPQRFKEAVLEFLK